MSAVDPKAKKTPAATVPRSNAGSGVPVGAFPPPLDQILLAEPYRFDFFQAVRILSRMNPASEPLGYDTIPAREPVRLRSHLALTFPPSEIVSLVPGRAADGPLLMTVAFFGLYGPSGALPRPYTELLLDRVRAKDHTLRDFLDIFNHRLLSLFYRAWEKYRFWLGTERSELLGALKLRSGKQQYRWFVLYDRPRVDPFAQSLLDLSGMGIAPSRYKIRVPDELASRTQIADETIRFYSGLLAQRHRCAVSLEAMIEDYFELPAAIQQYCGQWLALDTEYQSTLSAGGQARLGINTVVGARVWDAQGRFRVRLGPLEYEQFQQLLPSGSAFRPLAQMVRLYVGQQFDFDLQLVLKGAEAPWCQLSSSPDRGAYLGWNTWIRNETFAKDVADATLLVEDLVSCGQQF